MRVFLASRAIFFLVAIPGTVAGYVPFRIIHATNAARLPPISVGSLAATALVAVGASVLLAAVWLYFAVGRGTLAPIDPPRNLVVLGIYRFTRNPMYNGVVAILFGEAWLFASGALLLYAVAVFVMFNLIVILYEEPALSAQFGKTCEAYRAAVPRWGFAVRPYPIEEEHSERRGER
jgi:protein-S-isoprenylcysteine O-methyltransferase Ste14